MEKDNSFFVDLYFQGKDFKSLDYFSKSDPFVRFSMQYDMNTNIKEIGRTQTIKNNVNPVWKKKIPAEYCFSIKQPVLIEVFDEDSETKADFMGRVQTTLGKIMGAQKNVKQFDLTNDKEENVGKIIVRNFRVEESLYQFTMKWKGGEIANVDSHVRFWDKSDPYLKFLRIRKDNTFIQVGKTEVIMDNPQPEWNPITLPAEKLIDMSCNKKVFKVQCWDWDKKDDKHKQIGQAYIELDFLKNEGPYEFDLESEKIKKPGKVILESYQFKKIPNFIDFLKNDLEINMVTAIDFTGSNLDPKLKQSLHNIDNPPNQYQQVLRSLWDIIQNYDSDRWIPSFGFGGKPHFPTLNLDTVSHCFPLTGSEEYPQVNGFSSLMEYYVRAVKSVQFSEPTLLTPFLKQAYQVAEEIKDKFSYQILIILTDGQVSDIEEVKSLMLSNVNLPNSIFIVGIGDEDFESMLALDQLYKTEGQEKCPRDMIRFVPYKKFNGNPAALAKELLDAVPKQISKYFELSGKNFQIYNANTFEENFQKSSMVVHDD